MLRKGILLIAIALATLTGCSAIAGNDEGKTQEEIVEEVGNLGFFPTNDAVSKPPKRLEGKIVEQEVRVYVGLNRSPSDPKAEKCTLIVVWHENSLEGLQQVDGGYLMEDPNSDKVFASEDPALQPYKDCWQP